MTSTLEQQAQARHIETRWTDSRGGTHDVPSETIEAVLAAMDGPPGWPDETTVRFIEPVLVKRQRRKAKPPALALRFPDGFAPVRIDWTLILESGRRMSGEVPLSEKSLVLPGISDTGYHEVHVIAESGDGERLENTARLIVTPERCYLPQAMTGKNRLWGPMVQLYSLRSERNWGIGDFGDLRQLVRWAAGRRAGVIGLNPLHELFPGNPARTSPYSPSSRMFWNVLYIDIEATPDFQENENIQRRVFNPDIQARLTQLREARFVDYGGVIELKHAMLSELYQHFRQDHLHNDTLRAEAFRRFCESGGRDLEMLSLYEALDERFRSEDPTLWGWPVWPEEYRRPDTEAVLSFAANNRERLEFYQYLQWLAEEQLAEAGRMCFENHLPLGLYLDVAVGPDRAGAEVWANRELFAESAGIGAPPDDYNHGGQNWGLAPFIPEKLRENRYEHFIRMLRRNMAHAGALRLDHVMALMRLFWIPGNDTEPEKGTYVSYPAEEFLGILALESHRNRCMVIGEDLGTVPDRIREQMADWGVFGNRIFYFEKEERDDEDVFRPASDYPENVALSASNHDLPTLPGFWLGNDLNIRQELGLFPNRDIQEQQLTRRVMDRVGMLRLLEEENLLPEEMTIDPASAPEMTLPLSLAIHRLLARTPSRIFLFQPEDVLEEPNQINLPGTLGEYPNWRRKIMLPLEQWPDNGNLSAVTAMLNGERTLPEAMAADAAPAVRTVIPRATYRFQFNRDFTFRNATDLAPYLARLGVSHCYASPLLKSRPGSPHGYDIIDHTRLDDEIGTQEDFDHFVHVLREHGMGLVVDIVPNHMGIGKDNPWWMDVLENGPASAYSAYFDIDWRSLKPSLYGKVLLPVLGGQYGEILRSGQLQLSFDDGTGRLMLNYYEHRFPINPVSYPDVLGHRIEVLAARLGRQDPDYMEYESILTALRRLPVHMEHDPRRLEERIREKTVTMARLVALCRRNQGMVEFIRENLSDFDCSGNDPTNEDRLHHLLEEQPYRLAYWRVALDEINYRRFFDINDLAALRAEDPRVFADTHELILRLVGDNKIDGLRVDHIDGLYDPEGYCLKLQKEAARHRGSAQHDLEPGGSPKPEELPLYILVEKILAPFERLSDWPLHGTTGYDFLNVSGGLFVDRENEKAFTRIYERFIGHSVDYTDLVYRCKRLILEASLTSELNVLAHQLDAISESLWNYRDFTLNTLRQALMEVVAWFPVYRTYIHPGEVSDISREYVNRAIRLAARNSKAIDASIYHFIRNVLTLDLEPDRDDFFTKSVERFAMKFQQLTGPVMAKGVEDTCFYRYNRLVSLNEVGGEPHLFGTIPDAFHAFQKAACFHFPHAMLATSTHDTKRSEDVRARISVLSEIPDAWRRRLLTWSRWNRRHKSLVDNRLMPDRNDEYLLYQTLLGIWPTGSVSGTALADIRQRVRDYMLKAVREAKANTSWINQNAEYEEALLNFVDRLLSPGSGKRFRNDLQEFQALLVMPGYLNSLSQNLIKLTAPGVPDLYQGNELWRFSLVDPDNRRPVDYDERRRMLDELDDWLTRNLDTAERVTWLATHMDAPDDGRLKLFLMHTLLAFRQNNPDLFAMGSYLPLTVAGPASDHVVAYVRQHEDQAIIVAVPRLVSDILDEKRPLRYEKHAWRNTELCLPDAVRAGQWRHLFTGEVFTPGKNGELPLDDVFTHFPVACLAHS